MKILIKNRFIQSFDHLQKSHFFRTKKEFAEGMGISPQFLSQMLNDNTPVPLEFLSRFLQKYPVNPGFFFKNETSILIEGTTMPSNNFPTMHINSPQTQAKAKIATKVSTDVEPESYQSNTKIAQKNGHQYQQEVQKLKEPYQTPKTTQVPANNTSVEHSTKHSNKQQEKFAPNMQTTQNQTTGEPVETPETKTVEPEVVAHAINLPAIPIDAKAKQTLLAQITQAHMEYLKLVEKLISPENH